jgi:hypothetical protein
MPGASGPGDADPRVAATVRLFHRRQGWARTTVISGVALLLAGGGDYSAASSGTPPPLWFNLIVVALLVLTVVAAAAAVVDSFLLRKRPASLLSQAGPLAEQHPARPHARHYPPRHRLPWVFLWAGMLLILAVAVVAVPGVVNGVAYLAGAEKTVTFSPVSYVTDCQARGGCSTNTEGVLETGGQGTQATWPGVVPLGQPFEVHDPFWRWGLGSALISSKGVAVIAIAVSLLLDGAGLLVAWNIVRLTRNWRRHRRERAAPATAPAT